MYYISEDNEGTDMQVIALYGSANCGKSKVLKNVITYFKPEAIIPEGDFYTLFEINNQKIGIATGGDDKSTVESNLNYFIQQKCDFGITASRTKGGSAEIISVISNRLGTEPIWIKKSCLSEALDIDGFSEINKLEANCFVNYLKKQFGLK